MRILKQSALASLLGLCSFASFATVMPSPQIHQIMLSDGSSMEVRLKGTKEFHWYENRLGYALIQQGSEWHYAEMNKDSTIPQLISTGVTATSFSTPPHQSLQLSGGQQKKETSGIKKTIQSSASTFFERSQQSELYALRQKAKASEGTVTFQPLLVVQVSFSDIAMENDFTDLIFSTTQQSVKDYFLKNSFNKYAITPANETNGTANDGVIDVALDIAHPNCVDNCKSKFKPIFDAIYTQVAPQIDLASYDANGDRTISPDELSVMFIFAGNDKSSGTLQTPVIWPHKWNHDPITLDGVSIHTYCLFADYQDNNQSTMGVIAHELGHLMLALPDLYPSSHNDFQGSIDHWGLMGGGSWAMKPGDLYAGQTPSNMLAWSKEAAGFITPRLLTDAGDHVVQTNGDAAVVYVDHYLKELGSRIYLENRRNLDYDRSLPGEGLLITSVNINNEAREFGPMQVQILQADGLNELGYGGLADSGDLFPGSNHQTTLSDTTEPTLSDFVGSRSDVSLSNIASDANSATFTLDNTTDGNKYAWATSFERSKGLISDLTVGGFAIEPRDNTTLLDGIQFFAHPTSIATPQFKLRLHTYETAPYVLRVTPESGQVISEGYISSNNRIMFDNSIEIPSGKSTLVLEIIDGSLEYEYTFLDTYIDFKDVESWWGNSVDYNIDGKLFSSSGFNQISFGALLRTDTSSFLTAVDDAVTVDEDSSLSIDTRMNDFVDFSHQADIELLSQPLHGTYTNGIYTPNANFHGKDSFTYRLKTTEGLTSNIATVDITVNSINDLPTAVISGAPIDAVAGNTIQLSGLNSSDIDNSVLSYEWRNSNGYSMTGEYTAEVAVTIPDSELDTTVEITLTVSDEQGAQASQNITVNIAKRNAVPVAVNDTVTVTYGDTVTIRPLDNDTDADGDTLSLTMTSLPQRGNLSIQGNEIRYTASDASGQAQWVETFTYQADDGNGGTATGNITVTVQPKTTTTVTSTSSTSSSSGGSTSVLGMLMLLLMGAFRTVRTHRKVK
ncbi:M6 family metalloprotease domain-containing protein [Vibrio sp. S9_S30]|uniref:M6 family metalloprotease domain-containing protein n=1 Tax=Vibrio sp. S9_S30 TaxID=2720226 RepID=UPI00168102D1|nr:M6 family metalloprotease domain-containing protein [Vibrio sp. S9_S30]MBD1558049.1 M6 family metalloprotease domain-containing protein [Vibrio sp. S9_S30]